MPSRFRYDAGAARYRDAAGRFVTDRALADEIGRVQARGAGELERLMRQVLGGRLGVSSWHTQMRDLLRDLHVAAATAATGGAARMDAAARGQVGGRLRVQYAYLDRFAGELAAGLPRTEALIARARLYVMAVRATYEKALRRVRLAAGYTVQRNRERAGADHCAECRALTADGWVPIGSQPDPGERECGLGCQCHFEYRRAPGPAAREAGREASPTVAQLQAASRPLPPVPPDRGADTATVGGIGNLRLAARYLVTHYNGVLSRTEMTDLLKAAYPGQYRTGMLAAEARAMGVTLRKPGTVAPAPAPVPPRPPAPGPKPSTADRGPGGFGAGRNGPSDTARGFGFARPPFTPAKSLAEATDRLTVLLGTESGAFPFKIFNGGAATLHYTEFAAFPSEEGVLQNVNGFLREVEYLHAKYGLPKNGSPINSRVSEPILERFIAGQHPGGKAQMGGGFGDLAIGRNWGEGHFIENERRLAAGRPRWTWMDQEVRDPFGERDTTPVTARHELGHTFSAKAAQAAWEQAIARAQQDRQFPVSTSQSFGGGRAFRQRWFTGNVSEYGGSDDWWEEVAETASMVSSAEYIPGTLPAALESFVARLYQGEFFR